MPRDKKKIDWSKEYWKDMLIYQRKFAWSEDTLDKLATWLSLKSGMIAVDVGCGLGYLGYTYWPYFGKGGCYFGVDVSSKLLQDATKAAKEWAEDGEAYFTVGDVYKLPFPDNFADLVMCQSLLMHLKKPEIALSEMVRVAKSGGLIMCQEPDNLSPMLSKRYWSLPELTIEEQLLSAKVAITCNKGRMKLSQGDNSIGPKVPRMMNKLGLTDIGIRLNDRVFYLEPPYEDPLQQHSLESVKKELLDEKRHQIFMDRRKEEFLAGGGDPDEYERYREIDDRIRSILQQQIEDGEYFACGSVDIYIIKGRKPK
jgi:ubiquinone/menaquinone biosynthesis C-methylase UbiE